MAAGEERAFVALNSPQHSTVACSQSYGGGLVRKGGRTGDDGIRLSLMALVDLTKMRL